MLSNQTHLVYKYKTAIYIILGLFCVLLVYSFVSTRETSIYQIGENFIRTENQIKAEVGDIKYVIRNTFGPEVKVDETTAQIPFKVINFDDEEFKLTLYFKRMSTDSPWTLDRYLFY